MTSVGRIGPPSKRRAPVSPQSPSPSTGRVSEQSEPGWGGELYVCLYSRAALSQRSLRCVSGLRLDHARMLSIELGNWHSEWG